MQVEILKRPMMPSAIGIIGIILESNNLFLVLGCHFHESSISPANTTFFTIGVV